MPIGNLRIIVLLGLLCVYCCSLTTYKERVLLHAMRQMETTALAEPSDSLLFEGAMTGMIRKMKEESGDVYSEYIPPQLEKERLEQLDSRIEGIGVRLQALEESGQFKVLFPLLGSPAFQAGLRPNDRILNVDGESVEDWTLQELSRQIKGPAGTEVVLTILHSGEEQPVDLSIRRSMVQQRTVYGFSLTDSEQFSLPLPNHPDIGYIYISSFNSQTASELRHLLEVFVAGSPHKGQNKKLILDLRGDPGGYLDAAVQVSNFFVSNTGKYKDIVTVRSRSGSVSYPATAGVLFEGELVVLIDGGSASAAEIVAAALQDFGRATIVGERSYGKGTVQKLFDLPFNSGMLKLTEASYWRPSGVNINRVRFQPDSEMETKQKLSSDSDDWGVLPSPDCAVEMPKRQRLLTLALREYRSNVPESQCGPLLREYLVQFITDPENVPILLEDDFEDEDKTVGNEETKADKSGLAESVDGQNVDSWQSLDNKKTENEKVIEEKVAEILTRLEKVVQLQGTAPYYDPVLEKAIKLLDNGR